MRDFEAYAARERLESIRANTARKLTRQQRAQRRRIYRRTSAVFLVLLLCLCSALWGMAAAKAIDGPQETRETVHMETPDESESAVPAPAIEPSNCRWATPYQQANNTSRNRVIEWNGEKLTAAQWDRRLGFSRGTVSRRIDCGWSLERAMTQPPKTNTAKKNKNGETMAQLMEAVAV